MSLRIDRLAVRDLLAFGQSIYADDPAWAPPVGAWVRRRLDQIGRAHV